MKELLLQNGQFTSVDDNVYEELRKFKWFVGRGYAFLDLRANKYKNHPMYGKQIGIHRMVLFLNNVGIDNVGAIDHIDRNKLNNQLVNLRICSKRENCMNVQKKHKNRTSNYKGIFLSSNVKKVSWCVQIKVNWKSTHIATVYNEIEAAEIYDRVAKHYFKEFAYLNFPEKDLSPLSIEEARKIYNLKPTKCPQI